MSDVPYYRCMALVGAELCAWQGFTGRRCSWQRHSEVTKKPLRRMKHVLRVGNKGINAISRSLETFDVVKPDLGIKWPCGENITTVFRICVKI
jgi:hypothetical protein